MIEDTNVQDKTVEGKPEPDLHTETKPTEEANLPEGTKDRTKEQFDKLLKSKQEMAAKLKAYEDKEKTKSVLDSLTPKSNPVAPNPTQDGFNPSYNFGLQTPKPVKEEGIVDKEGYVNANLLTKKLKDAEDRAKKADERSQMALNTLKETEKQRQTKAAHEKYPQLDPHNSGFDPNFYNAVKNELIGQMMEGKQDLISAAEKVDGFYKTKDKTEAVEVKKDEVAEQKSQISAGIQQRSSNYKDSNEADLAAKTRLGDRSALMERLRRAGH